MLFFLVETQRYASVFSSRQYMHNSLYVQTNE